MKRNDSGEGQSRIQARGMVFDVRFSGPADGRPVLFLHGFPQTSWSWHGQLDALGDADMRAVAFDQRGYSPGARPLSVDDYRISELVSDALAVADALGVGRFDLVGHDWGAMVAWVVAVTHPERVRSLTAVSVPHPASFAGALDRDSDQARRSSYMEVFRRPDQVAERILLGEDGSGAGLRTMFLETGMPPGQPETDVFVAAMTEPGALTAALNWYRAMDRSQYAGLGFVEVPTLYVWSTDDRAIGRAAAEGCGQWVQGRYRFEVMPGVSHWIPETASESLTRLLLEHLADA